ncbi:polysaccharide biosynthesis/export family protein [Erythrobacter sp. NE805]|uniref:polysaccharide biosynthesis/export family protein n=1 Tax=Erythrobacter sp. NE805 TaxID=3389875 RepID=UPI00396B194E
MTRLPALLAALMLMLLAACGGGGYGGDAPAARLPPTAAPYTLGPGDKLRITVFGEETLTGEYGVTGAGDVSFPLVGNIPVAGRTVEDLQTELTAKLGAGYLEDPRVSAEIINYRPYYILGEVTRPGQYDFAVGLTIEQAVAAAGGFTYRANAKRVFLKRATETRERLIDLRETPSFPVRPGDTIRVGERFF